MSNLIRFAAYVAGWTRVRALLDLGHEDEALGLGRQLAAERLGAGDPTAPKIPAEDIDTMARLAKIAAARRRV